jgi:DNA mismatch endonuclease, patch repair protein
MTDIFTPEKRSWIMSRIRGTNTKIDLQMNEILQGLGFSYIMYPKMYGNPDFVLEEEKIVIFCDGDFWHGYNYHKKKKPPKKYWREKIEGNMKRDIRITRKLRREGWSVLRLWEHDIEKRTGICIDRIILKVLSK